MQPYTHLKPRAAHLPTDSGSTSNMSISVMTSISEQNERRDDDCPDYDAVVRSLNGHYYNSRDDDRALKSVPFTSDIPLLSSSTARRNPRPLPRRERYIHTYRLVANGAPLHFMISVEPDSGMPRPGKYTFRLSFKTNGIERSLAKPITRILRVDPRHLNFIVFMFPGKQGLPAGCLWSLRVWLRTDGNDHRLFGEDDLWVAKDPDFNAIADASFARLRNFDAGEQIYHGYVGKALVEFTVRWECVSNKLYKYSLVYEAGGVGDILFEDFRLRLDGDPRAVTFLIFTVPASVSVPAGSSHKLRVWIRSLVPLNPSDPSTSYVLPFNDSYIYQRIWKSDSFKIGGRLDFGSLGSKMIMSFSSGMPETIVIPNPPPPELHAPSPPPSLHKDKREYDV